MIVERFSAADVALCPIELEATRRMGLGQVALGPLEQTLLGAISRTFQGSKVIEIRRARA